MAELKTRTVSDERIKEIKTSWDAKTDVAINGMLIRLDDGDIEDVENIHDLLVAIRERDNEIRELRTTGRDLWHKVQEHGYQTGNYYFEAPEILYDRMTNDNDNEAVPESR